jgi:hypothetical protein
MLNDKQQRDRTLRLAIVSPLEIIIFPMVSDMIAHRKAIQTSGSSQNPTLISMFPQVLNHFQTSS